MHAGPNVPKFGLYQMLRTVLAAMLLLASSLLPVRADGGRVALVVGVSNYEHAGRLDHTLNDARDMAEALKRLGFDVETVLDPSRAALEAAIRRYGDRSAGAEVSAFYYSGHALEARGRNWLLPASANLNTERDLLFEGINLNLVLEQTDAAKVSVVFLDACRDNPFARRLLAASRDVASRGLGRIEPTASGLIVAFSTAPGQVASDGTEKNSPFTAALLKHIHTAGLEIKSLLARVTRDVVDATKGKQRPWQNSSLEGDFYFVPQPAAATPAAPSPANLDALFWDSIKASRNPADFDAYLKKFPNGTFADLARNKLQSLQQEAKVQAANPIPPGANFNQEKPAPPAAPAQAPDQAQAPSPASASFHGWLVARLVSLSIATDEAEARAKSYESETAHRAIAVSLKAHHTWRNAGWPSDEAATNGTLEACQAYFGEPCVLAAVEGNIEPATAPPVPRDMPRVRYAGLFDPSQIPAARANLLQRADVLAYRSKPEPKAAAYHPWGRLFVVVGVNSQFEAEEQALAQCNSDPDRKGRDGNCYLYAVGNQVVLPQRATKPLSQPKLAATPTAATPAGPVPATQPLHDVLVARLKSLSVPPDVSEATAKTYEGTAGHKTVVVAVNAHSPMRSGGGWPSEDAVITRVLETCQVHFNEPCTLAAVDDRVAGDASSRDMPRVRYAGLFDPAQLPGANDDIVRRPDLNSYRSASAPKAVAHQARGQIFIAVTGAGSQFEAEEQALTKCSADAAQRKLDGPCLLYAVGDTVILPKRLVKPQAQPRAEAVRPASVASSTFHNQMLTRFAALSVAVDEAEGRTRDYEAGTGHKAMAVAVKQRLTWRVAGHSNEEEAITSDLEGCQIRYGEPCTLVALGDKLMPQDGSSATRDMPRVRYAGLFDPERVPTADAGLPRREDIANYWSVGGPKAAAYHPSGGGRLFTVTKASDQFEAEEQVLAQCNSDPRRPSGDGPCFLYAVGMRVVLPQRLTKPRPRPQTISEAFAYMDVPRWSYQYPGEKTHKAIAIVPESGQTYRWTGVSSTVAAEERALEGCQLMFAVPCVLLASDDTLHAADPWKAPRRDMPRLHHKGTYRPESVPLFSGTEDRLRAYGSLPAPKAMVIRPDGGRIRTATGASPEDAQSKALAECNDDWSTNSFPCFIYAVNDRVILDQRRTEPVK
jgi:uncharacterized caspase-like protein